MPKEEETKKPVRKKSASTRTKRATAAKSTRKAPTKSVVKSGSSTAFNKLLAAIILAVVLVGGVSVFIGMTDKGPINVKSTIEQRAAALEASGKIDEGKSIRSISIPKSTGGPPNDGLVGRGNKETEQQKNEKAARAAKSQTASTSDSTTDTASSTDESVESETEDSNGKEVDSDSEESAEPENNSSATVTEEVQEENSSE